MPDLIISQANLNIPFGEDELYFIKTETGCNIKVEKAPYTIADCLDPERNQFNGNCIIGKFEDPEIPDWTIVLTREDIFLPIFTHVFGLAKVGGQTGVVSVFRLRDEFYGLPPFPARLHERLVKEIIHEYGHLRGLRHCRDALCVMASSATVDDLDAKSGNYCPDCKLAIT